MKKTCDVCGFEYEGNRAFCDACGTPVLDAEVNMFQEEIPVVELKTEKKEKNADNRDIDENKVIGVATYLGLIVLFAIPIVGLILCIIIVCSAKNKNLKNYAIAMLIWLIVTVIVGGLLVFAAFKIVKTVEKRLTIYEKQIEETNELFDQLGGFGDLLENYGEIEETLEQFENIEDLGDLSDVLKGLGDLGDLGETLDGLGDLGNLGDSLDGLGDLGNLGETLEGLGDLGDFGESLDVFGDLGDDLDLGGLLDDLGNSDFGGLLNGFGY